MYNHILMKFTIHIYFSSCKVSTDDRIKRFSDELVAI